MLLDKLKILAVLVLVGVAGTGAGVAIVSPSRVGSAGKAGRAASGPTGSCRWKPQEIAIPAISIAPPKAADEYRVDAGDVLGLFIEGVLGDANQIPPIINIYQTVGNQPPVIGFPVLVQDDGTISLLCLPRSACARNPLTTYAALSWKLT